MGSPAPEPKDPTDTPAENAPGTLEEGTPQEQQAAEQAEQPASPADGEAQAA